ncbi:transporter [bacterium]|jgi:hypothetical protein|nr:transporter [bacterium]
MLKRLTLSLVFITLASLPLSAHDWQSSRVDSHAPIGVMADHTHNKNELMFSYRYMSMSMNGNQSGKTLLSIDDVLSSFMVAPVSMTMSMYMFGGMYAITDHTTLSVMIPYIFKTMDHQKRDASTFTRETSGLGDITISALTNIWNQHGERLHVITGLQVPVGSIEEMNGQPDRLPYPMQLGSGTVDASLGFTYVKQLEKWSIGTQGLATLRIGENNLGYTLGNVYSGSMWISNSFLSSLSGSFRLNASIWNDINGSDATLNPMMVPTASTNRGGKQLDLTLGLNTLHSKKGFFKGYRAAIELAIPIYQSLDGTQLKTDWSATIGLQTNAII